MRTESRFFPADREGERQAACKELLESGTVKRGREGHEFWRQLGEVHHVYAFLMRDGRRIRLTGGAESPAMYSDKQALEKEIRA